MIRIAIIPLLLALSMFTVAQTPTQTVRGIISDAGSREGLPGANIILIGSEPLIGTTTTGDGRFVLENVPVGRQSFKITFIGYKPVIRPEILVGSGKEVFLAVELTEEIIEAGEVEIKATMDKDKPINAMAMVSARSFSVEETRRYAGSADDPLRAASAFAGVAASADVANNEIVVRGNSPKGLLWRVDGIDIPNPNHFAWMGASGGGMTMLSSQVLSNSDFYTAAFPAQYGNALSGVFDIRFRNGNSNRHEFAVQAGIQGLDLSAEGPVSRKNQSSYLFNYRYSILAFIQLIDPDMKGKVPQYQDLSFKLNFPANKAGTFSLFGIGGISRSKSDPEQDTANWHTLEDRAYGLLNNNMGALGVIHQIGLSRKTLLKSWISASYSDIRAELSYMDSTMHPEPQHDMFHQLYRLSGGMATNTKFGRRHTNRSGLSYTNMSYDINIQAVDPSTGRYVTMNKGQGTTDLVQAFTESKFALNSRMDFTAGIHMQYFLLNRHYTIEPRVGYRWQVTRRHALSMGYGKHSQVEDPGVYLAEIPITPEIMQQPNRSLDFTKAHHFVLGYDFLVRNDIRFKTEIYYQALDDVPVMPDSYYSLLNTTGGYENDTLVNDGTGRNYGIDLTLEKFLTKQYYYLVTVSLFSSKYTGGDRIERNTRFNSNYVVNLLGGKEWTIRKKNILGINLKATFTGGQYYIPIDLQQSVEQHREVLDESKAYSMRLPDVYYIDLTLSYRTNHRKYSGIWAIQVKNLLNRKAILGYEYNDFDQTISPYTSLGILPFISYKIEF